MPGDSEEEEGGSFLSSVHLYNQPVAASALTLVLHSHPTAPHIPISTSLLCPAPWGVQATSPIILLIPKLGSSGSEVKLPSPREL